jgi:hypothetical protein
MRLITGEHKLSSQSHLLAETKLLPVADQLELMCSQFLANAYQVEHPSHSTILLPIGERRGRKGVIHTLQSRFNHVVQPYLKNGVLPSSDYKKTIKAIHTSIVAKNKSTLINRSWGRTPPEIDPLKESLPTPCHQGHFVPSS